MFFLLTFFLVYYSMQAWAWYSFSRQLQLSRKKTVCGYLLALILALTPILAHILPDSWPENLVLSFWQLSFVWFGLVFYLFLLQAAVYLLAFPARMFNSRLGAYLSGKPAAFGVLLLALAVVCWGIVQGRQPPAVTYYELNSPKLETAIDIVFWADLHLGVQKSLPRLKEIVQVIQDLNPDLILFGGDLVNDHPQWLQEHADLLQGLQAPLGNYGVLGNHDFYVGQRQALQIYQQSGINVLSQETLQLQEARVQLLGLDDPAGRTRPRKWQEKTILDLTRDLEAQAFSILLSHRPWGFQESVAPAGVDLHLAAHTHQGQLFPFQVFVRLQFEQVYGLHQSGTSSLIVTRGAGTWGPPMRVFAPAEIVLIRLLPHK